jgi:hypothetical protein
MKIQNNTPNPAHYGISNNDQGTCGHLAPNQTLDIRGWDNQQNVSVRFIADGAAPDGVNPFSVTIPNTGTGMTVTIGLYQE